MKKAKVLSAEEQDRLCAIAHQDSTSSQALAARDKLVESSLGLVRQLAYSFAKQSPGYDVDDLIQEGSIALLDAIRWYNPQREVCFTTYAGRCIRGRLAKFLNAGRQKPFPQEPDDPETNPVAQALDGEPNAAADVLTQALARLHPTDRRVVEDRMGINGQVVSWGDLASQLGISVKIVRAIYERGIRSLRKLVPEPSEN